MVVQGAMWNVPAGVTVMNSRRSRGSFSRNSTRFQRAGSSRNATDGTSSASGRGRAADEGRRRSGDFGVQEPPSTTVQAQCRARRGLPQIQQQLYVHLQLRDRALDRQGTQGRMLPLTEVPRELGQGDSCIGGNGEGWIAGPVPPIVADAPGETRVQHPEGRMGGEVPDAHAPPRADVSVQDAQPGTPSYAEASSAKTRSISPRSMSCKAVRPPKTGKGVAMKRANPSGV